MTEERSSQQSAGDTQTTEQRKLSRRRLIHILATGGAITSAKLLPDRWIRPAVDSIILPAHAESSLVEVTPENLPLLDDQQIQQLVNDLTPQELEDLRSQLSPEEQQQLDEFLQQ